MKRIFMLLLLLPAMLIAEGQQDKTADDAVEIVIYNNSGAMSAAQGGASSDPEHVEFIREYIKERTGVNVIVIPPVIGQEDQKLNMLLASGMQIDAFWGNWDQYYSKNAIMPINDLMEKYGSDIMSHWPEESIEAMSDSQGNLWGVPRVTPTVATNPWVRKDWAEELGVKFPETIAELETFMAAAAANKEKLSGDDTIIMLAEINGKHGSQGIYQTFIGGFTEHGFSNWMDSDGKLKPYYLQDGYTDFLKTMNRWYTSGYMYPEFASLNRQKVRELVKTGNVASTATWYSNVANVHWDMNQIDPDAEFVLIQKGIDGPMGKGETVIPATSQGMLISSRSKHPEAVIKVMNLLYSSPEAFATSQKGPEGVNWEWTDKENGIYDLLTDNLNYIRDFDFAVGLPAAATAGTANPMFQKENEVWGLAGQGNNPPTGLDFSRGKMPFDAGVKYDPSVLSDQIPGYSDIERMVEEEQIMFIIGERPLSEWNDFIGELYDAGLQDWIDVHTDIYKEAMK
ncbi:extracellular solute-binding protein [Spirochaeta isovalerica]|uniref:ABC-type glycerol-3-phosphate transport system substrate-binding protein n=1 Tax=Spirochaeta isovalerica TaxID=150 RepID=A0A841R7Z1_9SPIO|nr:extracellular solute-binding protein [Spirochaeta isovalerica]MBB6479983.1 ABC-type glycerol-3-phosphate transport system substrate-binding protein [Spirochaeta isovalerica]